MKKAEKKSFFQSLAEFLFVFYIFTLYVFVLRVDTLIISQIAFMAFAGCSIMYLLQRKRFYLGKPVAMAYLFCAYVFLSVTWAQSSYIAMIRIKTMWQVFVLFFLVYNLYYEDPDAHSKYLKALYIAGISLCVYSVYTYGVDGIIEAMLSPDKKRLGREISQENVFGMNHATTAIVAFYYLFYTKRHKLFHCTVLASSFVLAASSGSRKALIMMCFGCLYLVYKEYGLRKLYKVIAVAVALILFFSIVIQMPLFNTVKERMEQGIMSIRGERGGDASAKARLNHIERGWRVFKENILLGCGADNYRVASRTGTYTHNNFIEVLADFGLFGFLIYYGMYLSAFKVLVKGKSNAEKVMLVLFIIRLVLEVANVTYYEKIHWIYMAFFLMPQNRMLKYKVTAKGENTNELNQKNC